MNDFQLFNRNTARHLPGASLLIALFTVAIWWFAPISDHLQYDRSAIAAGQLWRIVTCHLTHWSLDHLFWDLAAFIVLGAICELNSRVRFLTCVALSAVLIPLATWIVMPELATYRGLSGIDSAVFALVAVTLLRDATANKDWACSLTVGTICIGFVAKIVFEVITGGTLFVDSAAAQMIPVPLAHVVGAIVGAIGAVFDGSKRGRCLRLAT